MQRDGVTAAARAATRAAQQAQEAADDALDWLRQQRRTVPERGRGASAPRDQAPAEGVLTAGPASGEPSPATAAQAPAETVPGEATDGASRLAPQCYGEAASGAPLRLPHTDWLYHRLVVTGPADALAGFQTAASGAGAIPWTLDGDRMEEDLFHLLAVPPAPQRRRLSLSGARVLARQLRETAELRHAAAAARVGHSRACPLDLHALVPAPPAILRLGADHPDAVAWLWAHWGTTDGLRYVTVEPTPALRPPPSAGTATVRLSFWSADWTPWRAFLVLQARWPALRFDLRPTYSRS